MVSREMIKEAVRLLAETYNPVFIFIFGSYAWGDPGKDSDVDFLIVVKDSKEPFHKRARAGHRALSGKGFPKDLVILTEKELAEKMLDKQSFYADIIKNGVKTYEAA
jgi:uncharacterized protein